MVRSIFRTVRLASSAAACSPSHRPARWPDTFKPWGYLLGEVNMMGIPGMRSTILAPVARLTVGRFRFLCRLARLAPDHRAHCVFNAEGGALLAGLSRKS